MALIYEVNVRYNVSGNANRQLGDMEKRMQRIQRSHNAFSNAFKLTFAVIGIRAAGNALIGFNAEVERMKLAMATGIAANMGMPFKQAKMEADKLFISLQKIAIQSPGTTKDFMDMASMISRSVTLAGGDLKDLEQITKGAVLASKLYGIEAPMAALDVEQMLSGRVTVRDRLARQAISEMGVRDKTGQADHLAWNKLDPTLRLALTRQYFGKAFNDVAGEFENSIEGVLSTTKDKAQMLLGDIGKPLTEEVVKTAKAINKWLVDNQRQVSQWAKDIGEGLRSAFKFIKDAFAFIASNKETIISILELLLIFKGGQTIAAGITSIVSSANALGLAFGPLTLAATAAASALFLISGIQSDFIGRQIKEAGIEDPLQQLIYFNDQARAKLAQGGPQAEGLPNFVANRRTARDVLAYAKDAGALQPITVQDRFMDFTSASGIARTMLGEMNAPRIVGAQLDEARLGSWLIARGANRDNVDYLVTKIAEAFRDANTDQAMLLSRFFGVGPANAGALAASAFPTIPGSSFVPTKTKIDVSINKIEVASDDPDRFVMGMVQSFDEIVRNPTQAEAAIRGGLA